MATQRVTRRRRDAGFTMIEVMLSILLTAIAVIGILALYMTQTRATSFSRHMTEASVLASDGLELMRTTAIPADITETGLDEMGHAGGIYDRVSDATANGVDWDLAVTVSWDEQGVARSLTIYGRR